MLYRIVTIVGGIAFVAVLYGLIWLLCRQFLRHQGVSDSLADRATELATWTFAGVSLGLVFAVMGAFLLGPWAFYRTLRGHGMAISDAAAIWWGLAIVVASLAVTALGFAAFLWLVGAL